MTVLTLTGGLALDLGAANSRIYRKGAGVVLDEPSLALLENDGRRVLAVGREAQSCLGRLPRNLSIVRPLMGGVVSDFPVAREMLRRFFRQAAEGRRLFSPGIVMSAPLGSSGGERRALAEVAAQAGGGEVRLVEQPAAAALGQGLALNRTSAVVSLGGGTAEGAILVGGAAAFSIARRLPGDVAAEALARYIKLNHGLEVGESTAERLKMALGAPYGPGGPLLVAWGREVGTGAPRSATLPRRDLFDALEGTRLSFVGLVQELLSQAPPEMAAALGRDGLRLAGGGALLAGLDRRLAQTTGLAPRLAPEPLLAVILGLGAVLEDPHRYKTLFVG